MTMRRDLNLRQTLAVLLLCGTWLASGCIQAEPFAGADDVVPSPDQTTSDVEPETSPPADADVSPDDDTGPEPVCPDDDAEEGCPCDIEWETGGEDDALVCYDDTWCAPACDDDACDNSCGGDCGGCQEDGDYCNDEGSCEACGGDEIEYCPCGEDGAEGDDELVCHEGSWCFPVCSQNSCDNTCGGDCGGCGEGMHCGDDSVCVDLECEAEMSVCGTSEHDGDILYECNKEGDGSTTDCAEIGGLWSCLENDEGVGACACDPDSSGPQECGDDGCGGCYGSCTDGKTCNNGACEGPGCTPDEAYCDGAIAQVCDALGEGPIFALDNDCGELSMDCEDGICTCIAQCDGKACGEDGCGDQCGECAEGTSCQGGTCEVYECVPSKVACIPDDAQNVYICQPDGMLPELGAEFLFMDCAEQEGGGTCKVSFADTGAVEQWCHCGKTGATWCHGEGGASTEAETCGADGIMTKTDCANGGDHPWCVSGKCVIGACGADGGPCEGLPCTAADMEVTQCVANQGLMDQYLECQTSGGGLKWVKHGCGNGATCDESTGDCDGGGGQICAPGGDPCAGQLCSGSPSAICATESIKLVCLVGQWKNVTCANGTVCDGGLCVDDGGNTNGCGGDDTCTGSEICWTDLSGAGGYACYSCQQFCSYSMKCGDVPGFFGVGACPCTGLSWPCEDDEICNYAAHDCVKAGGIPDGCVSESGPCKGEACPSVGTVHCLGNGNMLGCMDNNTWTEQACGGGQTCSNGFCSGGGACIAGADAMEACGQSECCAGEFCNTSGSWCASNTLQMICPDAESILTITPCIAGSCQNGLCVP
jgi:hypothetical protein